MTKSLMMHGRGEGSVVEEGQRTQGAGVQGAGTAQMGGLPRGCLEGRTGANSHLGQLVEGAG